VPAVPPRERHRYLPIPDPLASGPASPPRFSSAPPVSTEVDRAADRSLAPASTQGAVLSSSGCTRYLSIPCCSIHSLALVAPLEPAFGRAHKVGIFVLMVGVDAVQCMITYYLHCVTMDLLRAGAGCHCNSALQWLCIFSFIVILWQEVSQTLDSIEFVLAGTGGTNFGEPPSADDLQRESTGETASEREWTLCNSPGADVDCCREGWSLCWGAAWCSDEAEVFSRQFSGFRLGTASWSAKAAIILFAGIPKLAIEGALLYVGSMYIATSRDNEEVITSVVAVTFICTLDDQILSSFISGKMPEALRNTLDSWRPRSRLGRLWVHGRTDWRMFIDTAIVMVLSLIMFHIAAFHASCEVLRKAE